MLMVIFGAGASFDSWPTRPTALESIEFSPLVDRLPLANQLFDYRPEFARVMSLFPRCQRVIPYLQQLQKDDSVERVLEKLQNEAPEYPERRSQLAAIRYYLHHMLWECEMRWKSRTMGITNYKTLLDQIDRWREPQEQVCLVTFNYDTLLEDALPKDGVKIERFSDYIASDYKIIKLHGSVSWAHEVKTPIENVSNRSALEVANELIDKASALDISQEYEMVFKNPVSAGKTDGRVLFPALAIPVETKQDYECPQEHLEVLRGLIPEVSKLFIIGWRATENHFLQLLHDNLRGNPQAMVVTSGQDSATKVISKLKQAGIGQEFFPAKGDFTNFVKQREADPFLQS